MLKWAGITHFGYSTGRHPELNCTPGLVGYAAANGYAFESVRCIFAAGGHMARRTFIAKPADAASVAAGTTAGCISVPIGATPHAFRRRHSTPAQYPTRQNG